MLDIRSAQQQVMENKRRKNFNLTDVPLELCLLQGEVAEFFEAWRRKQAAVGEELADVAIYVFGLAEIVGIDLQTEIEQKIRKNCSRRYVRGEDGVLVKVAETAMA